MNIRYFPKRIGRMQHVSRSLRMLQRVCHGEEIKLSCVLLLWFFYLNTRVNPMCTVKGKLVNNKFFNFIT